MKNVKMIVSGVAVALLLGVVAVPQAISAKGIYVNNSTTSNNDRTIYFKGYTIKNTNTSKNADGSVLSCSSRFNLSILE